MPSYSYTAMDHSGRPTDGRIDAPGRSEAIAQLARQDVYVTEIVEQSVGQKAPAPAAGVSLFRRRRRIRPRVHAAMLCQPGHRPQRG